MLDLLNRKSSDVLSFGAGSLAQQFVPRADGYLDFFPKGMRKTGYRVDSEARNRIMRLAAGQAVCGADPYHCPGREICITPSSRLAACG